LASVSGWNQAPVTSSACRTSNQIVMPSIRRARHNDLPLILQVEEKSFARDAWDSEVFLDYLARPANSVFLVATANRVVVGYALAAYGGTGAEIHSVAVTPEHRGRGVGAALLTRVIGLLQRGDAPLIDLTVRLENHAAVHLYKKLGFERVRRVDGYYEDGAPAWRMRRPG
jgi:ribosomal-protein-alanine N-acetyltransferase